MAMDKTIVLFDGVCNLCNHTVQFLLRHDQHDRFRFASQQSPVGQALLQSLELNLHGQLAASVVVIEGRQHYTHSDAVLHTLQRLGGVWGVLAALRHVPKPIREWFYALIARNRYRWFGRRQSCMLPQPQHQHRFLG